MRPSLYESAFACTTRALQCVSSGLVPVTSTGMRIVASIGIPTCNGAEVTKKNPPRETLIASEKCSLRSPARPSVRKRKGIRLRKRSSCRRSTGDIGESKHAGEGRGIARAIHPLSVSELVQGSRDRSSCKSHYPILLGFPGFRTLRLGVRRLAAALRSKPPHPNLPLTRHIAITQRQPRNPTRDATGSSCCKISLPRPNCPTPLPTAQLCSTLPPWPPRTPPPRNR
jgi:hypothetical protein